MSAPDPELDSYRAQLADEIAMENTYRSRIKQPSVCVYCRHSLVECHDETGCHWRQEGAVRGCGCKLPVTQGVARLEQAATSGDESESAGLREPRYQCFFCKEWFTEAEAKEHFTDESAKRDWEHWWECYYPAMGLNGSSQFKTIEAATRDSWIAAKATLAPAISRPPTQGAAVQSERVPPCPHVTIDAYQPCWHCRTKDRTDYNEPYEMAKQRVAIVERVMKLSYIKATRNTETGQERFVCRDDVITTIHDYVKATRALAEGQQSSELVDKTPSTSPGERE